MVKVQKKTEISDKKITKKSPLVQPNYAPKQYAMDELCILVLDLADDDDINLKVVEPTEVVIRRGKKLYKGTVLSEFTVKEAIFFQIEITIPNSTSTYYRFSTKHDMRLYNITDEARVAEKEKTHASIELA